MHPGMIAVHLKKMGVADTRDSAQVSLYFDEASEKAEEEFVACHFPSVLWIRTGMAHWWCTWKISTLWEWICTQKTSPQHTTLLLSAKGDPPKRVVVVVAEDIEI